MVLLLINICMHPAAKPSHTTFHGWSTCPLWWATPHGGCFSLNLSKPTSDLSCVSNWIFAMRHQSLRFIRSWSQASWIFSLVQSVQSLNRAWLFATPWNAYSRPLCPLPTARIYLNSCALSQWCHPTISSFFVTISSHFQSFPVSGSFQMSQFFASGGQSNGVSPSTSILSINTQDWSPLGWTV